MRSVLATALLVGACVSGFKCPHRSGWYPDRRNCSRFIECSNWVPYTFICPHDLHFRADLLVCDWRETANCNDTTSKDRGAKVSETPATPEAARGHVSTWPPGAEESMGDTSENLLEQSWTTSTGMPLTHEPENSRRVSEGDFETSTTPEADFDTSTNFKGDFEISTIFKGDFETSTTFEIDCETSTTYEDDFETSNLPEADIKATTTSESDTEVFSTLKLLSTSSAEVEQVASFAGTATPEAFEDRCQSMSLIGRGSDNVLRWRRWQYGEIMPPDVLKVGERVFASSRGRNTAQFAAVVRVLYNGTSHFATTVGPSRFSNSGVYFLYKGKLLERNYEFMQILCVNSKREHKLEWVPTSDMSCAPTNAVVVDGNFMIGRATHDPESGLILGAGVRQREPLTTVFKTVRTHRVYEILTERLLSDFVTTVRED